MNTNENTNDNTNVNTNDNTNVNADICPNCYENEVLSLGEGEHYTLYCYACTFTWHCQDKRTITLKTQEGEHEC